MDWNAIFFATTVLFVGGAYLVRRFFMVQVPGTRRWVLPTMLNEDQQQQQQQREQRLRGEQSVEQGRSRAHHGSTKAAYPWLFWRSKPNSTAPSKKNKRRAVVRKPKWAGLWERSLATAFTSCRKLETTPAMRHWQQPCTPKPWAHHFRSGPLDCTFLGTDYGGFYLPNRMCFLNEFDPGRPRVAYGFGIGSDLSYDMALASAYPSLVVRMFDPTPYAVGHARAVLETVERRAPSCKDISEAACVGDYFRSIADGKVCQRPVTRPCSSSAPSQASPLLHPLRELPRSVPRALD